MGLPDLKIRFEAAGKEAAQRTKQGVVALIVKDAKANGVHVVTEAEDIPGELGADNKAYIQRALTGYINRPSKVVAAVIPAAGAAVDGLALLTVYDYDYLAGPPVMEAAEGKALADAIVEKRKLRYIGKAVLPDQAADNEGVVNFSASGIQAGGATFTGAQYASRVAGMLAGTPVGCSATFAAMPEVTDVTTPGKAELDAAVDAGKLVLFNDGRKCKLGRAVTSKVTIGPEESEILKKIKLVETVDLIRYYAVTTVEDEYIGKYYNSYDNKCLLLTAVRAFLGTLEDEGVLEKGSSNAEVDVTAQRKWLQEQGADVSGMSDDDLKQANTGSYVFIRLRGRLLDAMEDFNIVLMF